MGTNLHSFETYVYKYLLPAVFIPWDGFRGIKKAFPENPTKMLWLMIAAWSLMAPFVFWYAVKLKTVVMDDAVLHIKGYFKTVDIPLADVASVKGRGLMLMHAKLRLKTPSDFGDVIFFMPRGRIPTATGKKLTLVELEARINNAA
jgi:hypothetical protein